MSTHQVTIEKITIETHPNADSLELAKIGGYRAVVGKGIHQSGDLVIYVPEQSVVPEELLKKWGFWDDVKNKGKLAGSKGDRVHPVRLRGSVSQGIVIPLHVENIENPIEGTDLAEQLGIIKFEQPVPIAMAGEVYNTQGKTLKYDIENIKRHNTVLQEGEEVYFTEKLHGTFMLAGRYPGETETIVSSKGLSANGLALKWNENNANNLYLRAYEQSKSNFGESFLDRIINELSESITDPEDPVFVLGEVFGKGIQDLEYGCDKPQFRVFDIFVGKPHSGRYLDFNELSDVCRDANVAMVPVLYSGPFSESVLEQYTTGRETLSGKQTCIREGIVVKPIIERRDDNLGRVILKSISDDYLFRKNATEFN